MAVLAALLLTPALRATVCTFDDLPQVPAGSLYNIPNGYCGIVWYGENGTGTYFSGSFQYLGTYYAHSQPNATADFSSDYYSFAFQSPAVFNGFWAIPSTNYFTYSSSPLLEIQVILSLAGNVVYTSNFTSVTSMAGAFISSGYSGAVDSVSIYSLGYYAQYGQYIAGGQYSIDDVTFNSICGSPTISPGSLVNVPMSGGTGSVNVTYPVGCTWTASSGISWITITGGASGSGNGTVTYQVAANSGGYREGTITVAGLGLPIQEAGTVGFTATGAMAGGGMGTTNVLAKGALEFSGSTWPIDGGPIAVTNGGTANLGSYSPPSFNGPTEPIIVGFPSNYEDPPCTTQITATQGSITQSVTLTGIYQGQVVYSDSVLAATNEQLCETTSLTSIPNVYSGYPIVRGNALVIEYEGAGSTFFINDLGGGCDAQDLRRTQSRTNPNSSTRARQYVQRHV